MKTHLVPALQRLVVKTHLAFTILVVPVMSI